MNRAREFSHNDRDDDSEDFSSRSDDGQGYGRSPVELVDYLLATLPKGDRRRPLLYQLRRRLQEDEITFQDARRTIIELEGALEKVTSPANRVGTYLGSPKEGIAYISLGGADYYANTDPRIDVSTLKVGTRVLVNEAYAVVGDLGYHPSGPVGKVAEAMEDGRLRVGQDHGLSATVLQRSSDLRDVRLRPGDEVRIDPNFRVALEHLSAPGTRDYYLEEIPEMPWSKVGGQEEAIQSIRDTIELPALYPDLFKKFQYTHPKGFLLHGPPGCGKTLIGKATAYNLVQRLRDVEGLKVEEYFMHIKGPEILNMWLGESERMVREIFARAREKRKEGYLPFVFIDEAEAILGTRRAIRTHNIANTVVPMFCSEMDGIESLQEVVIILASNRPDLIDPAILRPGRIDRKIKVRRPDKEASREIFRIYLTPDLPLDRNILASHNGESGTAVEEIIDSAVERMFTKREDTKFLEIMLRSGRKETLSQGDLASGAIIASIIQRAKERAIKRSIESNSDEGISKDDLLEAITAEYHESEIFPPTDNTEDWLKLLDYDPENVVRITPVQRDDRKKQQGRMTVI
ncbi:MAG: AAA family ATPase [Candidatus Latescibacteria bacterium]|nr:AAA family ATPase [Candidatus Latescibacterota bacterium]